LHLPRKVEPNAFPDVSDAFNKETDSRIQEIVVRTLYVDIRSGEMLVLRRKDDEGWKTPDVEADSGQSFEEIEWDIPGGGVNFDEALVLADIRESTEESGFKPDEEGLVRLFEIWDPDKEKMHVYYAYAIDGPFDVRIDPEEHTDYEWAPLLQYKAGRLTSARTPAEDDVRDYHGPIGDMLDIVTSQKLLIPALRQSCKAQGIALDFSGPDALNEPQRIQAVA
jgi:ADP-ribose pyrophosphatase YjhB (NUDIX family)